MNRDKGCNNCGIAFSEKYSMECTNESGHWYEEANEVWRSSKPRDLNPAEQDYELFKQCGFNPALYKKVKNGQAILKSRNSWDVLIGEADSIEAHGMGVSLEN